MKSQIVAIVGPPSSGKTTLLEALAQKGFNTIEEQARKFIPQFNLDNERLPFQLKVASEMVRLESNAKGLTFIDTGRFCNHAYLNYYGVEIPKAFETYENFRYAAVFETEVLPFVEDGVRRERDSSRIADLIRVEYEKRGMTPIKLTGSTEERVKTILSTLNLLSE